jgi:hypothetical protein
MADCFSSADAPSGLPAHLLDPPDVDGIVGWIRSESRRRRAPGFTPADDAVATVRSQLAAIVRQAGLQRDDATAILGNQDRWRPIRRPRLSSHRRFVGPVIAWCKRHLVLPFIRWHVEFTVDNAARQAYVDRAVVGILLHLGTRIVLLERQVDALQRAAASPGTGGPEDDR